MEVKIYTPHIALQEYVLNILTIDAQLPKGMENVVTPYPPSPFQSLIFYCNNPVSAGPASSEIFQLQPITVLTGPQYSRINVKVHKQIKSVRVDFLPGALHRLLGVPMDELFNMGFDAVDLFGASMRQLNEQLQDVTDMYNAKILIENFLLYRINSFTTKALLPFDPAMQVLLKAAGDMSIKQVASLACLSIKQFERKCKERIGMNPKTFTRILKFSKAYRLHEQQPTLSWTNIAYEAGYYDQMHMIKDFKVFAGVNPSVIEAQLFSTPLRMQKHMRY